MAAVVLLGTRTGGAGELDASASAETPDSSPGTRRKTDVVIPPKVLSDTSVNYPEGAQGQATVMLELLLDVRGEVMDVRLFDCEAPFDDVALSAAVTWKFQAGRVNGEKRAVRIRFQVRFEPPAVALEPDVSDPSSVGRVDTTQETTPVAETIEVTVLEHEPKLARSLSRADVRQLSGTFGDPFCAIESLPEVTPIGSGMPFFYVRGAPPGNVGYFVDGIRVPVLYQVFVGQSVSHPAFVDRVDLYGSPFPARCGRFTGGIVAAEPAAPQYRVHGEASLRQYDAGAMLEALFADGRGSAMVSARYSYTAAVLSLIVPELSLSYWDDEARARYELNDVDAVEVFAFGFKDFAGNEELDGSVTTIWDIGFHRLDLRFAHRLSETGKVRFAATGGIDFTILGDEEATLRNRLGRIRAELSEVLSSELSLQAGADVLLESYDVSLGGERDPEEGNADDRDFDDGCPSRWDTTGGVWAELALQASRCIRVRPGLRLDLYGSDTNRRLAASLRLSADFLLSSRITLTSGVGLAHQRPSLHCPCQACSRSWMNCSEAFCRAPV